MVKNDEKTVAEIAAMNPRGVLVSPGPGAGPFLAWLPCKTPCCLGCLRLMDEQPQPRACALKALRGSLFCCSNVWRCGCL